MGSWRPSDGFALAVDGAVGAIDGIAERIDGVAELEELEKSIEEE